MKSSRSIKNAISENLRETGAISETPAFVDGVKNLTNVITRTALNGESNSVLIIGPQGAGKSRLLKIVMEDLKKNPDIMENLIQVHLTGLFQTDNQIALKEITRQLQLENETSTRVFASFAENLRFLLDSLKDGNQDSKSVLFLLDEFDLFCHHKNQTLLYNLFDIAQSAQTPIVVIGLTCRLDVVELLEKRVKSRFSHRQIHIFPPETFAEYTQIAIDLLTLPKAHLKATKWNQSITEAFKLKKITDTLQRHYNGTKDIRSLKQLLFVAASFLADTDETFPASLLTDSHKLLTLDSKSSMLKDLSILELCLIISTASLTLKYDHEPFNFQMVFEEYSKFARNHSRIQSVSSETVSKAFDHLKALEFVKVSGTSGKVSTNFQLMTLMLEVEEVAQAVKEYPNLPTDVYQWASTVLV